MLKSVTLISTLLASCLALATTPAPRPRPVFHSTPARAICKDDHFMCMYSCVVREGAVCQPTRGSDRGCPERTVTNGHWISDRLIVLDFEGYGDMGCRVIAKAKTNVHCGMTKFGWDCWPGSMTDR